MTATAPKLGPTGRAFWKRMHAEHQLDAAQEQVLALACRQLDVGAELRKSSEPKAIQQERLAATAAAQLVKALDQLLKPSSRPKPRAASRSRRTSDPRAAL